MTTTERDTGRGSVPVSFHRAWQAAGWFGLVVAVVGATDVALVFYPARFGDPGWEFGVVDTAYASLPLVVIGVAALLASLIARRRVIGTRVVSSICLVLGLGIVAGYLLYLLNVPLALNNAPDAVLPGIYKSIVRTTVMTVAFGTGFMAAAVMGLKSAKRQYG